MPTVHRATWQLLRALGVRTVFGNPGSTEIPFLADFPSDVDYVLALHEGAAVGMADAYAQLTGAPALVNLHTAVGVGNAMGAIVNAARSHSPLVITAGQQVRAMLTMQPFLANPDATALPKPAVKWAFEPPRAQDVPAALAGHDLILVVGAEVFAYYPWRRAATSRTAPNSSPSLTIRTRQPAHRSVTRSWPTRPWCCLVSLSCCRRRPGRPRRHIRTLQSHARWTACPRIRCSTSSDSFSQPTPPPMDCVSIDQLPDYFRRTLAATA